MRVLGVELLLQERKLLASDHADDGKFLHARRGIDAREERQVGVGDRAERQAGRGGARPAEGRRSCRFVMAGLVPAIHVFHRRSSKDVDARHEAGHDERERAIAQPRGGNTPCSAM